MAAGGVESNRRLAAALLQRALAGESLSNEAEWPDDSDDESVETALTALDEYLNDIPLDADDREYWSSELGRMADALSRGESLDEEQLNGWRGTDVSWLLPLLVLAVVVGAGWLLWRLLF